MNTQLINLSYKELKKKYSDVNISKHKLIAIMIIYKKRELTKLMNIDMEFNLQKMLL